MSPKGSDSNPGTQAKPWRELTHAAEKSGPGDVIEVLDGTYKSPIIFAGKQATAAKPIIVRAAGAGANVDGIGANGSKWDNRDAIYIYDSSHIIVHGLRVANASRAGLRASLSHHVTVQACTFATNGVWGSFTDFADDVTLTGNECSGSIAGDRRWRGRWGQERVRRWSAAARRRLRYRGV